MGKLTPQQQTEFLSRCAQLIEANYVKGLRANLDYTVDYTGEDKNADGNVVVHDRDQRRRAQGRPYQDRGRLRAQEDGDKHKAWDVKTDGVGLVENYRRSVQQDHRRRTASQG